MELRFSGHARSRVRSIVKFGGTREEDISAPPQEPQAHAWVSQADADAGGPRSSAPPAPQRAPSAHGDGSQEVGALIAAGSAGTAEQRRERFPRAARVRRRADYLAIQNRGRRVSGANLMLFALAGNGRIGITVSRKVGIAVVRNRVKRWIRDCWRRSRADFPGHVDMVVVARPSAAAADHAGICRELSALARRLGPR